ncbi:MAG TPA: hypothetical protein VFS67_10395 [Polyangiaceae bacterium]|nr:hypothetical protein [Polyangiaceae bacterium]
MSSEFRASTPADGPQIAALARRSLGVAPGNPMFTPEHMHWKYWSRWPEGPVTRSFVLTRNGQIVAHAGVLPLVAGGGSSPLSLLHPFDWASEPTSVGAGAALLKRIAGLADGLLIVGGSPATRRMAQPLGFRAAGEVACYAARVPAPELGARRTNEHWELRALSLLAAGGAEPDSGFTPPGWLRFRRTRDQLGTLASCPAAQFESHAVLQQGAPLGGFVLAFAPFQARIAAFWCRSEQECEIAALLQRARERAAAREGVEEVVCMTNLPAECRALSAAGFQACPAVPMFLLAPGTRALPTEQLAFQMLDGDFAFLHHGARQPWL